jgi:aryl-alcohol dehydrogenase-like predicted oxidoreductase
LGRGFLTGSLDVDNLALNDFRRTNPRFSADNAKANEALVAVVREVAKECAATPAQVALAWVLSRGDDVVPIPGTKRVRYVEENARALDVALTPQQLQRLDSLAARAAGERYAPAMLKLIER